MLKWSEKTQAQYMHHFSRVMIVTYRPLREWVHLYLFQVLAANGLCLGPFGNIQYGSSFQPLPPSPSSDDEHRRPLNFELNTYSLFTVYRRSHVKRASQLKSNQCTFSPPLPCGQRLLSSDNNLYDDVCATQTLTRLLFRCETRMRARRASIEGCAMYTRFCLGVF